MTQAKPPPLSLEETSPVADERWRSALETTVLYILSIGGALTI